jgi:hypothetical protein
MNANGVDPGTNSAALAVLADAARRYPAKETFHATASISYLRKPIDPILTFF